MDTRPLVWSSQGSGGCRPQTILSQWWLPALDPPHRESGICALLAVSMRPWAPADSCCPIQLLAVLPAEARGGGLTLRYAPWPLLTLRSKIKSLPALHWFPRSHSLTPHWAGPLSRVLPAALHRSAFLSQPSDLLRCLRARGLPSQSEHSTAHSSSYARWAQPEEPAWSRLKT